MSSPYIPVRTVANEDEDSLDTVIEQVSRLTTQDLPPTPTRNNIFGNPLRSARSFFNIQ